MENARPLGASHSLSNSQRAYLSGTFDDPDLGKFGKAFYFYLVPEGKGTVQLEWPEITQKVNECYENSFSQLGLPFRDRQLRRLFRKYMAVTLRWTSKLTGRIARDVIDEKRGDDSPLNPTEQVMHDLRYGRAEHFGKINVGYLYGCGPLFATFFNDVFRSVANGELHLPPTEGVADRAS